jgi:hydrogenase 3 maturation protease
MAHAIKKKLKNWFTDSKKVVIAGIGNPIRCDDYVGLKIVEQLKGKLPKNILLLEAETVPESYLSDIQDFEPSHVLLIDAANLGLNSGQTRLVDAEVIANYSTITTHLLPLRIFCEYIKQATGAKIALLLIEPENMEFGEGLTPKVAATAQRITKVLTKLFV